MAINQNELSAGIYSARWSAPDLRSTKIVVVIREAAGFKVVKAINLGSDEDSIISEAEMKIASGRIEIMNKIMDR